MKDREKERKNKIERMKYIIKEMKIDKQKA